MADVNGVDASIELIQAMFVKLRASAALTNEVGTRLFDRVPEDQVTGLPVVEFPYVTLGPTSSTPDDYDCMDREEIVIQWHVWTSGPDEQYGSFLCRKICNIIKRLLHGAELALTTNALATLQCEMVRIVDDPNPSIRHGVVILTAMVETP